MLVAKLRIAAPALIAIACLQVPLPSGAAADSPPVGRGQHSAVKVLVLYDLEGVTGCTSEADVQFGTKTYPAIRESLTEDVNAAIRGLLKAGASEVVVTDGHGSGNPEPDYLLDRLPNGARFDIRDEPYDAYIDTLDKTFSAVVAIGMHSGAGTDGFLSHTYFLHTKWTMGGLAMNESMLLAASAARFGVPLILVTGDQVLQKEVEAFSPMTAFVTVKRSASRDTTEPRPREEASAAIEAAAERALRGRAHVQPWRPAFMRAPFDNLFAYRLPEMAALALMFPHAVSVDTKTIRLQTTTFLDAYLAFRALGNFTGIAQQVMLMNAVWQVEGGRDVIKRAEAKVVRADGTGFEGMKTKPDPKWSPMGRFGYK